MFQLSSLKTIANSLVTPGPRMVDEAECVISVLLAIFFAHMIGGTTVYWAAFSALVLMRGHVSQTLLRGFLRILGTIVGAGVALLVVPLAAEHLWSTSLLGTYACAIGLYGMMAAKRGYAWFLYGLTIELVLFDKIQHPEIETLHLATTRLLEVSAGTVACIIVSAASTFTVRRWWPAPAADTAPVTSWNREAARHALIAGATIGMLPLINAFYPLPELEQAAVTVMAVMILPLKALRASNLRAVGHRLINRLAGCLGGSAFAATVLFAAHGTAVGLIIGTIIGVIMGRHIENSDTTAKYAGLQFTLAVLVVLVPDDYSVISITPALERLASIFVGMGMLVPVLLLWHLARMPKASKTQAG